MYEILNAHPLTLIVVAGSVMVTPVYLLATYVFSGASPRKGLLAGLTFLALGALMSWVCLSDAAGRLGLAGNLIVPAVWILPSCVLYLRRDWFVDQRLSQKWLVGLQLFRAIGGVFLIEMARGNLPGIFAYPAGVGDLLVALVALSVLVRYARADRIPGAAVWTVIVLGVLDFLSAFFFGFFSSETPLQLFFPATANQLLAFPTGMIPLFLVPYAIFFHTLSALQYFRHERAIDGAAGDGRAEPRRGSPGPNGKKTGLPLAS